MLSLPLQGCSTDPVPDDVSCAYLRPSAARWQRSGRVSCEGKLLILTLGQEADVPKVKEYIEDPRRMLLG